MIDWQAIDTAITAATGTRFVAARRTRVGGGAINSAYRVESTRARYFVKLNELADSQAMFAAEAAGLAELGQAVGLRVPGSIVDGATPEHAYLVLEYIEMRPASPRAMSHLGEALADMHGIVRDHCGWHRDNTIGSSHQPNAWHPCWTEFWRENRLAVMLDALAQSYPELARLGERVLSHLDQLLAGHRPEASLVHGDLWSGNIAMDRHGTPVLFDPAVYYGDRETDLAMAELFGGLPPLFFEAYWGAWPPGPGYRRVRRPLYQLYHVLNHARLFGGHYVDESQRLMRGLLARL